MSMYYQYLRVIMQGESIAHAQIPGEEMISKAILEKY